jgi:hypothetical protein
MSDEIKMLIGTYTENSSSKGIYYYSFNQNTGDSKLLSTIFSENPSFITVSGRSIKIIHKKFWKKGSSFFLIPGKVNVSMMQIVFLGNDDMVLIKEQIKMLTGLPLEF